MNTAEKLFLTRLGKFAVRAFVFAVAVFAVLPIVVTVVTSFQAGEILGYFNGAADQTRGKNVKVKHTRCASKGDPVCEYTITWDE